MRYTYHQHCFRAWVMSMAGRHWTLLPNRITYPYFWICVQIDALQLTGRGER